MQIASPDPELIQFIYKSFSFRVLGNAFKDAPKSLWKSYLKKKSPGGAAFGGDLLFAIGNGFKYEKEFLEYMDKNRWPSTPSERHTVELGELLHEMGITSVQELREKFKFKRARPGRENEPKHVWTEEENNKIANGLLDSMINKSGEPRVNAMMWKNIVTKRAPLEKLDPAKISALKSKFPNFPESFEV
jgi:hypothetical protein